MLLASLFGRRIALLLKIYRFKISRFSETLSFPWLTCDPYYSARLAVALARAALAPACCVWKGFKVEQ